MKKPYSEIPWLKGERVTLRRLTVSDAGGVYELTCDDEVYRRLADMPVPYDIGQ